MGGIVFPSDVKKAEGQSGENIGDHSGESDVVSERTHVLSVIEQTKHTPKGVASSPAATQS